MEVILIVALILFLIQIVAWLILPGNGQVAETSVEFSSLGDESAKVAAAATK